MSPEFRTIDPNTTIEVSSQTTNILPPPSHQWAWLLAVIATGGSLHLKTDPRGTASLSFSSYDSDLLTYFKEVGETLLSLPCYFHNIGLSKEGRPYQRAYFYDTRLVKALGDLRSANFPLTILDRYSWIYSNPNYTWGFLEGMFETSGYISMNSKGAHRLGFSTSHLEVANFIADMLSNVGLQKIHSRINGVRIDNVPEIKIIADHIQSYISNKEKKLEYYRELSPDYLAGLPSLTRGVSDEECIAEWQRMKTTLGHTPSKFEIDYLKKMRKALFSAGPFIRRFGSGSFPEARDEIEKIILERLSLQL